MRENREEVREAFGLEGEVRAALLVETARQIEARIQALAGVQADRLLHYLHVERGERFALVRETRPGLISLREYLKERGRVSPAQAAEWLAALVTILVTVHAAGQSLGGLTQENLFLSPDGKEIYALDFHPTRILAAFKKGEDPNYLPPEVIRGEEWGAAADLYSLGVTLYLALTGVFPFADVTPELITENILEKPLTDPRYHNPEIGAGLAEILFRLLARSPAERPTASALAQAVAALRPEAISATPEEEKRYRREGARRQQQARRAWARRRFFRRHWGWLVGGVAAILILFSLFRGGKSEPVITSQTTPQQVVEIYYRAIDDLDVLALQEAIEGKAGKQIIDLVSRLHVIEAVNLGMQLQSGKGALPATAPDRGKARSVPSRPDLLQIQNLRITPLTSAPGGKPRFRARYRLRLPGEGGGRVSEKEDLLTLGRREGKWRIIALVSREPSPAGSKLPK